MVYRESLKLQSRDHAVSFHDVTQQVKEIDPNIMVEQAAGITCGQEVYDFIMAGSEAAGAASGIMNAADPIAMIDEMIAATRRAALPEQTLRFKPLAAAPADSPGFAELRALNPDVCGWLTLDGTRIDFPVVQGADNMVYVNTDVYGNFSLSGAIFLDSRCPADFTAPYSIVYGHHIEDGGMFGDIVQFTQSDYFAAHTTGTLVTDDTAYNIALFACVRADAYDPVLYDPAQSPDALLAYIKAHAVQYRTPGSGPVVAFSTCTEAATNGRVLLFGQLLPQT